MKKFLSVLLSIMLLLSCVSSLFAFTAQAASGSCGDNVTWDYKESTRTLTISGTGDMDNYRNLQSNSGATPITSAPWKDYMSAMKTIVISNGVTSIGSYAFCGARELNKLTIADTVKSIGSHAFDSSTDGSLFGFKLTIPNSVTSIGSYAFFNCLGLQKVTIPGSVTNIGSYAFCLNNLNNVIIENGVKSIDTAAFSSCHGLSSVSIPDSVTTIGDMAFWSCTSLESVTVPDSVTSIGEEAFSHCRDLKRIYIGNHVKSIGDKAFDKCVSLTDIALPNSVTSLGRYAFNLCVSLKTVILPAGIANIAIGTFHLVPTAKELQDLQDDRSVSTEGMVEIILAHPNGSLTNVYCAGGQLYINQNNEELRNANIVYNAVAAVPHNVTLNARQTASLSPEIIAAPGASYTVKYESSKTWVAKVNEQGDVTGGKRGTAVITCTATNAHGVSVATTGTVTVDYTVLQWFIAILLFGWLWF